MADVITQFKLETTQYDSKLRDAAKGLKNVVDVAKNAGNSFTGFSQKAVEAARALGNTASGATNTKDKVKDLVGSFNDAAKAYNKLTEEQQKSDFGRELSQSLTVLQGRIREAKQELYGLGDAVKKSGGLFSGDKLSGMLQVFGGNMMTKAADLAMSAFSNFANEIGDAVKQGIELAKQGEGIRIAFERLGRSDILDGLRKATHGTVTDLELMKAAVKFNDFKLPLEELGTMLAFAQQKAKDTGQSVDYMVDSIVTGLGRKSLMILDNLGLSAAEIKEKMAETGDMTKAVGAIIREQMSKAGDYVETAADRAAQANVSLQNKMEELGRKFAPVEEASSQLWTSMKIGILDIIGGPLATLLNQLSEAGRLKNMLNNLNGDTGSGDSKVGQQLKKLQAIRNAGGSDYMFNSTLNGMVEGYNRQIMKADELIKKYKHNLESHKDTWPIMKETERLFGKMYSQGELETFQNALKSMRDELKAGAKDMQKPIKIDVDTSGATQDIEKLKEKIKKLTKLRDEAANKGDTKTRDQYNAQIKQTRQQIKATQGTTTTSHTTTPSEQAAKAVESAEQEYARQLEMAALELKGGKITEAQQKQKQLTATEALWAAYGKASDTVKGTNADYIARQKSLGEEIVKLGGETTKLVEAQKKAQEAARQLEQTQKKFSDALTEAADAYSRNDLKGYIAAQKKVGGDAGQGITAGGFSYTSGNMDAFTEQLKDKLSQADLGSTLYQNLTAQLADATTLANLMQVAVKNGIDTAQFNPQELWKKVFSDNPGDYIEDSTWEEIRTKLEEIIGKPIKIDLNTGEVKKDVKAISKAASVTADVVGSIGQAFNAIEDPAAKVAGTVAQAIANVALGYSEALKMAKETGGPWAWIAFAATGLATMITTISSIHSATGYAHGGVIKDGFSGIVPGNSYSGDNIPANNGHIMLNSGETVLNVGQSRNVASALIHAMQLADSVREMPAALDRAQQVGPASQIYEREGGGGLRIVGMLKGEDVVLMADRWGMRTGRGELLFGRNL